MDNRVTPSTYVRNISFSLRSELSCFLDPYERWKDVIVCIKKQSGEPRYSQRHVRQFELLVPQGKSPTVELLNDWGTSNCTVRDLVDILKRQQLLAAARLLLPEEISSAPVPSAESDPEATAVIGETRDQDETTVLQTHIQPEPEEAQTGLSGVCFSELQRITGDFDDRPVSAGGSRLGEGGFGTVYKGVLRNRAVAVKKLKPIDYITMEELLVQFNQEIQTLQTLQHENLVDMVGFCSDGPQPCLVYAFMCNGSLLDRLACLGGSPHLSWRQRCSIALGTAEGLEYLHENHHVHRDIKRNQEHRQAKTMEQKQGERSTVPNILLDQDLVAKISDFGWLGPRQTLFDHGDDGASDGDRSLHGPRGSEGQITPKSDIFSFGVVLLEILSGLPPADADREPSLLMELRYDIEDEDEELTLEMFLDKHMSDWSMGTVESVYALASNCLMDQKNRRPLISQVVAELKSVIKNISLDSK